MKSIVVNRLLVSVVFMFIICEGGRGQIAARDRETMGDPLFGVIYDTAKVHFERAPVATTRLCSELRGRRPMWLYAAWRTPQADYFILSGLIQVRPDGPSREPASFEPDGGVAVELRGTECRLSSIDWLFSDKANPDPRAPRTTQEMLSGLVSDALRRYVTAFGSRQNFVHEIEKSHVSPNDMPPLLRRQFQMFVNTK